MGLVRTEQCVRLNSVHVYVSKLKIVHVVWCVGWTKICGWVHACECMVRTEQYMVCVIMAGQCVCMWIKKCL